MWNSLFRQLVPYAKCHALPGIVAVLSGTLVWLLAMPLAARSEDFLKGRVEQTREETGDYQGQVLDAQTGQPLPNAEVSLPDTGFKAKTDAKGFYRIPPVLGKHPVIMSITKPGYSPLSASVSITAPPMLKIRLEKQKQLLVLDNVLRHLGDGSFSHASSNAASFRKPPDGPAIRIPFSIGGMAVSKAPYLQIGSIIGLDTPLAHLLKGNPIDAEASPLLIKLNGMVVAKVQVNGDNQKIQIPPALLRPAGNNILEIEAGYQYPEPGRIDYDDMELIHLVLHL